jgi:uncharacterized membrane protein YbhN (UPF0104 family)
MMPTHLPLDFLERLGRRLRGLLNLRVLAPAAVGLGLIAYVADVAAAPQGAAQLWQIVRSTWWLVLLLIFPYLALRALIWRRLLGQLGMTIPWRPLLVAFAGGEITKELPGGVYVQNYLLARLEHFRTARTARATMATTAVLGLEAALAVPAALILGWPGQHAWVRWTLLGVVVAWIVCLVLAWLLVRFGARHLSERTPDWIRQVTRFLESFLEAGGEFVSWRTVWNLVPTALYLLVYVIYLYAIAHTLGVHGLHFLDAVAIYSFVVLSVILIPVPTAIGPAEFTGMLAFESYGIPGSTAAILMLSLRLLATGATIVVASGLLLLLRQQLSAGATSGAAVEPAGGAINS